LGNATLLVKKRNFLKILEKSQNHNLTWQVTHKTIFFPKIKTLIEHKIFCQMFCFCLARVWRNFEGTFLLRCSNLRLPQNLAGRLNFFRILGFTSKFNTKKHFCLISWLKRRWFGKFWVISGFGRGIPKLYSTFLSIKIFLCSFINKKKVQLPFSCFS